MTDSKDSNPKDAAAVDRAPIGLVSLTANVEEALALTEGMLKYGAHNYTIVGVRSSVYVHACARHLFKWWLGQEYETVVLPDGTEVEGAHHLGHARACLGVLLEARAREKLRDDRPPSMSKKAVQAIFDRAGEVLRRMQRAYGDRNPRHYTIADTEPTPPPEPEPSVAPDQRTGPLRVEEYEIEGGNVVRVVSNAPPGNWLLRTCEDCDAQFGQAAGLGFMLRRCARCAGEQP